MDILPVASLFKNSAEHKRLPHKKAFANGAAYAIDHFCPIEKAGVPITDLGFTRADAVYDVVSVSRGQFFKLAEHQQRFAASLKKICLSNPFSLAEEAELLHKLVALTGLQDAYVWWGVTRGATPSDSSRRLNPDNFANRYFAYAVPYIFIADDEQRQKGINIWVSEKYIRIPKNAVDPRAKNLCSLDLAMSLIEAGQHQAQWSVLTDGKGFLTEAPGSNIFVIKDNAIATPDEGCLEGITRQSVMELCGELNIPMAMRPVSVDEFVDADEAFLTSTAGGIMPIDSVNNKTLGGKAGPGVISSQIHNLYWQKRWQGWCGTPVNYHLSKKDLWDALGFSAFNPFA